jgi:hypothetical protein
VFLSFRQKLHAMKNTLLLLFFLLSLFATSSAQLADFPTPGFILGAVYHNNFFDGGGIRDYSMRYLSDTVFCGKTFH